MILSNPNVQISPEKIFLFLPLKNQILNVKNIRLKLQDIFISKTIRLFQRVPGKPQILILSLLKKMLEVS